MQFTHAFPWSATRPSADWFVPAGGRAGPVKWLGIGAHQDDLEFMAWPAIQQAAQAPEPQFGGVVLTDGRGSPRAGQWASVSDDEIGTIRREEQREAARLGHYAWVAQLDYPSGWVRQKNEAVIEELCAMLAWARPDEVWTHNPLDRHPTHIGVVVQVMEALRRLPEEARPSKVIGGEVWRGLDWVPPPWRQGWDVAGARPEALFAAFASQIEAGKNYGEAVVARWKANATFADAHAVDAAAGLSWTLDLTPCMARGAAGVRQLVGDIAETFARALQDGWKVAEQVGPAR